MVNYILIGLKLNPEDWYVKTLIRFADSKYARSLESIERSYGSWAGIDFSACVYAYALHDTNPKSFVVLCHKKTVDVLEAAVSKDLASSAKRPTKNSAIYKETFAAVATAAWKAIREGEIEYDSSC